jgi:antitoxin component YwqK of YwqJK toxin-antitoxin module
MFDHSIRIIGFYFFIVFFSLIQLPSFGQCVAFEITSNGDTLNCKDKTGKKQGKWTNRIPELRGEPGYEEEGVYHNDEKTGYWRIFSLEGDLMAIEQFRYGQKSGIQQYFNTMGNPIREESWLAHNPEQPTEWVEVYDLNDPSKVQMIEVKIEGSSVPHGIWKIYDPETGKLLQKENYIIGKKEELSNNTNEKNEPNSNTPGDTEKPKTKPRPKEVEDFEKKNDGKKKYKIRTGSTG